VSYAVENLPSCLKNFFVIEFIKFNRSDNLKFKGNFNSSGMRELLNSENSKIMWHFSRKL